MSNISLPSHSEKNCELLAKLESQRDNMLQLGMQALGGAGTDLYLCDFIVIGAVKRYLSTLTAFKTMIESWNLVCARTLLRTQIDTVLRFSAIWLVEDPHELASKMLAGERINNIKDKHGKKMRDSYLVELHAAKHPWLPTVYDNLSGFIHFSSSHIFGSVKQLDSDTGKINFEMSDRDLKYPESSWREMMECFYETGNMLAKELTLYAEYKHQK